MRSLAQAVVVRNAGIAALLAAAACLPRFLLWSGRDRPIWFLELAVLSAGFFLWSFVFGWQAQYGARDPLKPSRSAALWSVATGCALAGAALNRWLVDPVVRTISPQDFPPNLAAWAAGLLFALSIGQLFMVFAPMAFFLRLAQRGWLAIVLTLGFGLFVMSMKLESAKASPPPGVLVELVLVRLASGAVGLWFYLKGGLPMAWWMALLAHARYLPDLR
jgi:hypothetical protein